MIDLFVNGESRQVAQDATITSLLAELSLLDRRIAVERNGATAQPAPLREDRPLVIAGRFC